VAPLLAVPLAAWLERLRRNTLGLLWLLAAGGVGLAINGLAVLFDIERAWQDHWTLGADVHRIIWLPYFSHLTAMLRVGRDWLWHDQGGWICTSTANSVSLGRHLH
jgi:hypothetical protein